MNRDPKTTLAELRAHSDRLLATGIGPNGRARVKPRNLPAAPSTPPPHAAVLITLRDVEPEQLTWLWPGRLPTGKLVTLDGDPGLGKSTLGITFAAHISTGEPWPDGAECPLSDVVILSAEDGLTDTIRPRLDAAGGNPARVHAMTAVRAVADDGTVSTRPPTLADIGAVRETIERTGARLLIVDVLMAYLPGKVDSHRDQDVRAVLHRVAEVADATGCTILLLRHLNKTPGGSAMYRGGGSIGIIGAARAGFVVAPDPDNDKIRVLACVKSNLAPMPDSLCYQLEGAPDTGVVRVAWTGVSTHTATALLDRVDGDERTERDEAVTWLLDYLTGLGGEAIAGQVIGAAVKAGIAKHTVQRARKRAGVISRKGSMGGGWVWAIPTEDDTEGDEDAS